MSPFPLATNFLYYPCSLYGILDLPEVFLQNLISGFPPCSVHSTDNMIAFLSTHSILLPSFSEQHCARKLIAGAEGGEMNYVVDEQRHCCMFLFPILLCSALISPILLDDRLIVVEDNTYIQQ